MIPRLPRLRWPTPRELLGGLVVAALFGIGVCAGTQIGGPVDVQTINGATHYDTVSVERIVKAEPPAKPGLLHRAAYRDVQPERVQVAPGAGRELLAAVCDTGRSESSASAPKVEHDSSKVMPVTPPALALPYTEKGHPGWTPWSGYRMERTLVGPAGLERVEFTVRGSYEVRYAPERVIREQRAGLRWLKPLPFVAATFAAGWLAHSIATQF